MLVGDGPGIRFWDTWTYCAMQPICARYNIPLTSGRGFAGPSIWKKMAKRFRSSGKDRMVVLP